MLHHIRQYYLDEKGNAVPVFIAAAICLLIGGLLMFKYSGNALAKGMGTGFLIIAVLMLGLGVSSILFNNTKLAALTERAATSEHDLRESELQRMDKVMDGTFRYAFITFGVLMMVAMGVIIGTKSDHWRGLGIALMVLVALAVVFDSFNLRRNREYQATIQAFE
jgi:hypothetical protein